MTHQRDTYKGRVFPPDVSEFSSLFPQPFENIGISAVNLHMPAVHLPLFLQLFFLVPSPIIAPKHCRSLVELEDKIEGFGVRLWLMTPPFRSAPLTAIVIGLTIGASTGGAISQATNTSGAVEEVEMG